MSRSGWPTGGTGATMLPRQRVIRQVLRAALNACAGAGTLGLVVKGLSCEPRIGTGASPRTKTAIGGFGVLALLSDAIRRVTPFVKGDVMRPVLLSLFSFALVGCGSNNLASNLVKPPDFDPNGGSTCKVQKSQSKPLIVEWPSPERGELEAKVMAGLAVARYTGCELKLLTRCTAPGGYAYTSYTPKKDTISIKNQDELYANIPVGAAKFEAKLATAGELGVEMTLVGRYLAENDKVRSDHLKGRCDGATHIIAGLTVGAFEFFAAGQAEVGGGLDVLGAGTGGKSKAKRETLTRDGDPAACRADGTNTAPPAGCGAVIRIEVVPLECVPGKRFVEGQGCVSGKGPASTTSGSAGAEMVLVPAGEFGMGCAPYNHSCKKDEKPRHMVYLDAFYIDKTEVTVDQYVACVKDGQCTASGTGRRCNYDKSGAGGYPINCVDWNQANAFCRWAKKRLPTEAQWEKAARGTDDRMYPWGNQKATCSHAVMDNPDFPAYRSDGCGRDMSWPVGSRPAGASPYGALDMAGNLSEWVADYYDEGYYENSAERNPTGPSSGSTRVLRGGGYIYWEAPIFRATNRFPNAPGEAKAYWGFRCARPAR